MADCNSGNEISKTVGKHRPSLSCRKITLSDFQNADTPIKLNAEE